MDNTLFTIIKLFLLGFYDCFYHFLSVIQLDRNVASKIDRKTEKKERLLLAQPKSIKREARIWLNRHKVLKCIGWCSLISLFVYASIFVFYYLVLPLLETLITGITGRIALLVPRVDEGNFDEAWGRVKVVLAGTFNLLWLLPLFIVSKIVCGLWFGEVADNCYFIVYGKPATPTRISTFIADLIFSIFIQLVFLMQCSLVSQFPVQGINIILEIVHCSLIHSWYAFEYKWLNFGWDIKKRLLQLHTFWPYYVGFGLPMHFITTKLVLWLSDYKQGILSGCLFSTAFPLLIIAAISSSRELKLPEHRTIVLRIFEPSVTVTDWLMVKIQKFRLEQNHACFFRAKLLKVILP